MRMLTKTLGTAAFAMGLGLFAAPEAEAIACAGVACTASATVLFGPATPSFSIPLTINQFDASLGTLTSFHIDMTGLESMSAFTVTCNAQGASSGLCVGSTLAQTTMTLTPTVVTLPSIVEVIPTKSYAVSIAGTGGTQSFVAASKSDTQSFDFNIGSGWSTAGFIGAGTIGFNVVGVGSSGTISSDGTATGAPLLSGSGSITYYYDYTPTPPPCTETQTCVPEPASLSLLGTGLIALGALIRRRRRQAA